MKHEGYTKGEWEVQKPWGIGKEYNCDIVKEESGPHRYKWHVGAWGVNGKGYAHIATVSGLHFGQENGDKIAEANGRLIADAPRLAEENERLRAVNAELVEACKMARFVVNCDPTLHPLRGEPWWDKLNAAIAKAEEVERLRAVNTELAEAAKNLIDNWPAYWIIPSTWPKEYQARLDALRAALAHAEEVKP